MSKRWYLVLPLIVFLVSCLDLGTTLYCDKNFSEFKEANPIARTIWKECGETSFIVFKLGITLLSCYSMGWALRHKNRRWQLAVSIFGLTVCAFLICWWFFWFF